LIIPEVGMAFDSEEKAYEMYNTYAGEVGFSIRKSHTKLREDKTIGQKYIVCSNEGYRKNKSSQKYIRRTICNARVQFSASKKGIWTVQKVILDHNHYLASPNKLHKLKSQRRVTEAGRMPQCPRLLESYILMKTCNSGVLIKMPLCNTLLFMLS
jgi:zinc finger SWIM domain-containing protein 3